MEGIVGEGVELTTAVLEAMRPSEITYHLAKHLLYNPLPRSRARPPRCTCSARSSASSRRWIDEGYLVCQGRHEAGDGHLSASSPTRRPS